jgi:hypothetical protein
MTSLKVTSTGFDIPATTFIQTSVELAAGLDIGQWIYVDKEEADVIIVNTDTMSCQAAITQYASLGYPKEGLFISCAEDSAQSSAATLSLKRPVTYSALTTLLTELQIELQKRPNKPTPPLTTEQSNSDPKAEKPEPKTESKSTPHPSPSVVIGRILTELPTQEIEFKKESILIEESTTEVKYFDPDRDNEKSVNISDLFEAAELSVLEDIVRPPADKILASTQPPHSNFIPSGHKENPSPLHSVEHLGATPRKLGAANERDLLLLDRPARRFYEATRYLGIIKNIIERNQSTEITHYLFPTVRIYPDQKTYTTPLDDALSAKMFRTLAVEFSTQKLTKMSEREAPVDWQIEPLWKLLFHAALYGSEGRLMENVYLSDKLQLISEPDYDIVPGKSEYDAIAYTMADESVDLKTIADESGVIIETVIDFCNACEEAQLIQRTSSGSAATSNTDSSKRSQALIPISTVTLMPPTNTRKHRLIGRFKSLFNNIK